jgi:hypothetical protein
MSPEHTYHAIVLSVHMTCLLEFGPGHWLLAISLSVVE